MDKINFVLESIKLVIFNQNLKMNNLEYIQCMLIADTTNTIKIFK